MTSERDIQAEILSTLPDANTRLWRLPVGSYAVATTNGRPLTPGEYRLADGRRISIRRITIGTAGMSDLFGLRSVVIQPEDVGQRFARFATVEVKSGVGRATVEQAAYIEMIAALGGLAGIARSVEEAGKVLTP